MIPIVRQFVTKQIQGLGNESKRKTFPTPSRLPKDRIRLVEEIAREDKLDKSTVLNKAMEQYAKKWRLERTVESLHDDLSPFHER